MTVTFESSWPSLSVQLADRWTSTVEAAPHPPDLGHPASSSDGTGHLGPVTSNMIDLRNIFSVFNALFYQLRALLYKLNHQTSFYKSYNDLHLKRINLYDICLLLFSSIICHLFSTNTYYKRNCSLRFFSQQYLYMFNFGSFLNHICFYEE